MYAGDDVYSGTMDTDDDDDDDDEKKRRRDCMGGEAYEAEGRNALDGQDGVNLGYANTLTSHPFPPTSDERWPYALGGRGSTWGEPNAAASDQEQLRVDAESFLR